jgi:hypothetical protein
MATDNKYGFVGIDIPEDEPIFILRGQDLAAADTIAVYAEACRSLSAPAAHIEAAENIAARFIRWAAEHPDRMKVPD